MKVEYLKNDNMKFITNVLNKHHTNLNKTIIQLYI